MVILIKGLAFWLMGVVTRIPAYTEVETMAREQGCTLSHLDTFDFQAKDF